MKKVLRIEIETTPKKIIEEGEDITEFCDRTMNNAICRWIREKIEDEDLEEYVMEYAEELPQKITDFCDFGSVKILCEETEIKEQKTMENFK